jgi:hypothetical protein
VRRVNTAAGRPVDIDLDADQVGVSLLDDDVEERVAVTIRQRIELEGVVVIGKAETGRAGRDSPDAEAGGQLPRGGNGVPPLLRHPGDDGVLATEGDEIAQAFRGVLLPRRDRDVGARDADIELMQQIVQRGNLQAAVAGKLEGTSPA